MLTRTVHTLRRRTEFVDTFNMMPNKTIEVRRLSQRRGTPHYIVVYKDIIGSKNDWDEVAVITEVSCINNISNFDVKPSKQYPDLVNHEDSLKDKIRNIISLSSACTA